MLSQELRAQVIQQFEQGKQYSDIAKELRVSLGSVFNILKTRRIRAHTRYERDQDPTLTTPNNINISGNSSTELVSDNQEIDFSDNPVMLDIVLNEFDYDPRFDLEQGERRLKFVDNGESGQAILGYNIEPEHQQVSDVQQTNEDISDNQYNPYEKVIEIKEIEESNQNQSQSRSSNPTDQTRPEIKEEVSLDINWDSEENYKSRFVRFVSEEKHKRSLELHQINLQWHRFKQEKARLEQEKRNFELASADLAKNIKQFQEILPIAQSLTELGLDLSIVNSWLTTVSQVAQSKNLEMRTAAYQVSEEVQDLQFLGGVKKAIEQKNHELEILGIAIEDRQRILIELGEVQTELEATKLEVERNKEILLILTELQRSGPLDIVLAKVKEYDSLTKIINIERLRQFSQGLGQSQFRNENGLGQTYILPEPQSQTVNQPLSDVDKI